MSDDKRCDELAATLGVPTDQWEHLLSDVSRLRTDNERLQQDFHDLATKEATLTDLAVRNGQLTASIATEMAGLIANQFYALLEYEGAKNYLEMHFHSRDGKLVTLTLQRENGKTPHQLKVEAEQERDQLRADLVAAQQKIAALEHTIAGED